MPRDDAYKVLQELCNKVAEYANEHRLNLVPFVEKATDTIWFQVLPQEVEAYRKLGIKTPEFLFTETGIGTVVKMREFHKYTFKDKRAEYDITDYSCW